MKEELMAIDNLIENNGGSDGIKENGFILQPVSPNAAGEGLPYAPEDWPNPGDNWSWKVGRRVAISGYYLDRYLYLPNRFQNTIRKKRSFASKLSVEQYVRTEFPGTDVDAFFASFSWKIPAQKLSLTKGNEEGHFFYNIPPEEGAEQSALDSQSDTMSCKARNKMCNGFIAEARNTPLLAMPCDFCCRESDFCRNCCCILCCKTIDSAYGGYSYIKCEATVGEGYICGHIAHINCALRIYIAGTVGGSIDLDAEYQCRRCDARTDLVSHVTKLIQTCQSVDSRDDAEKILSVGICILRGSKKATAKSLLNRIELAMAELKCGTYPGDIWKAEDNISIDPMAVDLCYHHGNDVLEVTNHHDLLNFGTDSQQHLSMSFDDRIDSQELEDEIDEVLQALRKSQESEYKIAEERLHAQKSYLFNLNQQLDKEKSELVSGTLSNDPDALFDPISKRMDQIKREAIKLREMEEVAKGFGRTSKYILKEHFGLESDN